MEWPRCHRSRTILFDWILAPPAPKRKKDSLHSPEHSFRVELKGKIEVSKGYREAYKNWRLGVHQNKVALTGFANSKTSTKTFPKHWIGKKNFHVDFSISAYEKTQMNFFTNSNIMVMVMLMNKNKVNNNWMCKTTEWHLYLSVYWKSFKQIYSPNHFLKWSFRNTKSECPTPMPVILADTPAPSLDHVNSE